MKLETCFSSILKSLKLFEMWEIWRFSKWNTFVKDVKTFWYMGNLQLLKLFSTFETWNFSKITNFISILKFSKKPKSFFILKQRQY
jgi:hypothetical protein